MPSAHVGALAHGFIAVLLLLTGCGKKAVHRPGQEFLQAIKIEGNESIKTDKLLEGLALRRVQSQGSSPDPYLVVVDGQRIRGEYLRRGFLEVDVRSRVERRGDATTVIYTVHEGPRARTRVMITGLPADQPELTTKVRDALPLQDGEYFSYETYDAAKEKMLSVIEDAGFAHVELDAHVIADRVNHLAVVHLDYDLGPKSRFGTIDVSGVDGDLADAVRARVAFDPGQQYSSAAIADTQRALTDMNRFSTVSVVPDKSRGEVINVRISVGRSARNEIALGGGLGSDPASYEARVRAGYTRIGWPLPLTDFTVDLRPAYAKLREGDGEYEPRLRALTKLRRIDLFRPFVAGEVEAAYTYIPVEGYTSYGPLGRLGIESPVFTRKMLVRGGWQLEYLQFRNISPLIGPALQAALGLDQPQRVGEFQQVLSLDLRDNPIEPTTGLLAEVRIEEGSSLAGSALEFYRITPELRGYISVPDLPIVFAVRARAGQIWGDVPVTERYFSGGASTHRGFGERRLSPTVVGEVNGEMQEIPIGGTQLFESNFELRTRLTTVRGMGVGAVTFFDGGNVADRDEVKLNNLFWAFGVGARLFTIVGAVRADVGYRLNRYGPTEPDFGSRFAFHLSIGEAY